MKLNNLTEENIFKLKINSLLIKFNLLFTKCINMDDVYFETTEIDLHFDTDES